MFVYPMGRALVWALTWVMSGPGPKPRPPRSIERGDLHFTEFIRVVGLGSKLDEYAGVVCPGRLFVLMAYASAGCPFRCLV